MSALSKSGLVLSSKTLCTFILNLVFETTNYQLQGENKTYNSGVTREVLRHAGIISNGGEVVDNAGLG